MKARRRSAITVLSLALVGAGSTSAHDFFLRPTGFTVPTGSGLSIDATVSGAFPDLLNPVTMDRVREIRVAGGGPRAALEAAGVGSKSLRLRFHGHEPGYAVLALATVPRAVEYPEDRIGGIMEEYHVSPEAAQAVADLPKPRLLKVISTRFAKSFVCVERCEAPGEALRPVGHDLEFTAVAGAPRSFRLLSMGRALADYPAAVVTSDGVRRHFRTGADGVLALPDEARGPVMVFASVMETPSTPDARFALKLASLTAEAR